MSYQESLKSCRISTHFSPKSNSGSTLQGSQSRRGPAPKNGACSSSSSLFQERLREKTAERRKSIQSGDGAIPGSPKRSSLIYEEKRPSSSGLGTKGMGVKQWEEQTSTLHKQNYNLKLELYHRRDRQNKLEAELAVAQKIIEDQAECQEMNEMLLFELDRRDQAVDEAINLIISLEEQIEILREENQRLSRTHDNLCNTESNESISMRQQRVTLSAPIPKKNFQPRPLPRVPSFLSENNEGTEALRSLYTKYTIPSDSALSKLNEEDDEVAQETIDSPRLSSISRLSESSFISVYGDKNAHAEKNQEQDSRQINPSVLNWVEEAPSPSASVPWTPLSNISHNIPDNVKSNFLSHPNEESPQIKRNLVVSTRPQKRMHPDLRRFEDRHTLPPTPDTFCTGNLRVHSRNSDCTLNQREKGLVNSCSASERSISDRPKSACETITSRRSAQDWDSSSETDGGSINRTTEENSFYHPHLGRVKTPLLFTFNESEWDRDIAYYQDHSLSNSYDPALTASEDCQTQAQRTSVRRPSLEISNDKLNFESKLTETLIDDFQCASQATTAVPESLSNQSESLVTNNLSPVWKRNPISLTLARFRRSDHSSTGLNPHTPRPKATNKGQSLFSDQTVASRNVNPPVLMQRDIATSIRPVSADSKTNIKQNEPNEFIAVRASDRQRQASGCNLGTLPHKEVQSTEREREEENSGGKSVRKWLGLGTGRSNSMRKN